MHQDAHEFLNYVLNTIAEDIHKHEQKLTECRKKEERIQEEVKKTWLHQVFEGILSNETKCLTCETVIC